MTLSRHILKICTCIVFLFLGNTFVFSQGATSNDNELISRVNFGLIPFDASDLMSPPSGTNTANCTGYSDFTIGNSDLFDGNTNNAVYSLGVSKNQTYDLEVEGGFCISDPNIFGSSRGVKVFVDFNANNDFTDAGELVYSSAPVFSSSPIFNTSVLIPNSASIGEITMRIVYARINGTGGTFFWDFDFFDWSTLAYTHGETEDYTLVVTAFIDLVSTTDISCASPNSGEIIISPSSGAPATTEYSINGLAGPFSSDLVYQNLPAGNYSVLARDASMAPDYVYEEYDVTIEPAPEITLSPQITSDYNGNSISCAGVSDGEITLTASGGLGSNYTYEYTGTIDVTPTPTSNVVTALAADTYTFIATDDLGCSSSPVEITIEEPMPISIDNVEITTPISCDGSCDATLTIFASGSTPPYNYQVDGVDYGGGNIATGVCQGTPTILVSDANDCSLQLNTFITAPEPLTLSVASANSYFGFDVSCSNSSDGAIECTPNGGTAPYQYSIDGGLTFPFSSTGTEIINSLSAGNYSIIVRDSNSCESTIQTIILDAPLPLSLNPVTVVSEISCNGFSDGEINTQAIGGVGGYTYSLDNGTTTQTNGQFSGLSSGSYTIQISDDNSCVFQEDYFLTEPELLTLNGLNVISDYNGSDISCYQLSDGIVEVLAQGGTEPYYYSLLPDPATTFLPSSNLISNLSAGIFTVQIVDDNQCLSNVLDVELISPEELIISDVSTTSASCFNFSDGDITIQGTGGTGAYSYYVDALYNTNSQSAYTVSNLLSGNYNISLTDANGCSATSNEFISQPPLLESNLAYLDAGCSGDADGSAIVNPSGGTPAYTVVWSNGSTQFDINQLVSGNYSVTITDNNNCQIVENFEVTEPVIDLSISPILCYGANSGQIQAILSNANLNSNFNVTWDDPNAQTTFTASGLSPGTFTVQMVDQFGCELTATATLEEPDSLVVFVEHSHLCENDSVAIATVFTSGGITPYSYLWNTNEQTTSISLLNPDNYSVQVTDFNGCMQEAEFFLDSIRPIRLDYNVQGVSCVDNTDGFVEAIPLTGYQPFSYQWTNFANQAINSNVPSGQLGLTVVDSHNCTAYDEIIIPSSNISCITAYSAFSPNGDQNNDYWHIENIELYPDGLVEVFNRWGDRVYSTKNYINGWDGAWKGTYNNKPLPSATYYYVITLNNDDEPLVGTVTIVR
ncbi:MAG: gliding motility-associated C-terminal domain-containing protein [Flavobacteriales bacterium]